MSSNIWRISGQRGDFLGIEDNSLLIELARPVNEAEMFVWLGA
jgi:hypothetical protein